jgi:hypothetical protein
MALNVNLLPLNDTSETFNFKNRELTLVLNWSLLKVVCILHYQCSVIKVLLAPGNQCPEFIAAVITHQLKWVQTLGVDLFFQCVAV